MSKSWRQLIFGVKNKDDKSMTVSLLLAFGFSIYDIFLNQQISPLSYIIFSFVVFISYLYFKIESNHLFLLASLMIFGDAILVSFQQIFIAEKLSGYLYFLIVVAVVLQVVDLHFKYSRTQSPTLLSLKKIPFIGELIYNFFDEFLRHPLTHDSIKVLFFKSVKLGYFASLFLIASFFIITYTNRVYKNIQRNLLNITITKYGPKIVYPNNRIILYGRQFGDFYSENTSIYLENYGKVKITSSNNEKIVVEVGLDWPEGQNRLYVQKVINWDGRKEVIKSAKINVKLIPRIHDGNYPNADDIEFLDHLKTLDVDILKTNDY